MALTTPAPLDSYGFGLGPSGPTAVVALALVSFSFAVVTVFAYRIGLVVTLAVPPLSAGVWTVHTGGGYRTVVMGFLLTLAVGVIECAWRRHLHEWITRPGVVAAGVHVSLALAVEYLSRVPRSIGPFVSAVGVPFGVFLAGVVAAGATTLAADHDVYAPVAVLLGWLGIAVRDTVVRIGEPRLTGFRGIVPFRLGPTPDYLFQLAGLAVLAVAVAAVEWDLRRCVDGSGHGSDSDSKASDGDPSDPE